MAKDEGKKEESTKKKEFKPYKPGKFCPKCGSGMAEHNDRYTCGKCGYTEWKRQKKGGDSTDKEEE
ncbi:MAG: 30S ribosomal protein S27ae [Candidatus Micrarchaeia archaeon]